MSASFVMLCVLASLFLPGIVLGHSRMALTPRLCLLIFAGFTLFFMVFGLFLKGFPSLFDPRL